MTADLRVGAAVLAACLLVGAPVRAQRGESSPAPAEEEGPFAPMIRDLGRRLGVDLRVGTVALNPLIGAVILRDVEASSGPQGRFLTARRVVARLDVASGGEEAHTVDIQAARLSLDVSRAAVADEREGKSGHSGKVRLARLRDVEVELRDGGSLLLRAKGVEGRATDVSICSGGKADGSVCGGVEVDAGTVSLGGDDGLRLQDLGLDGVLEGRRLDLASLTGTIGGGRLQCEGVVTVFEAGREGTKLDCRVEGARISRKGAFDLAITGKIRLVGKGRGIRVSGTVDAVGGSELAAGRWGKRGGEERVSVDLRVRVVAPSGRVEARIEGTPGSGRVVLKGRKARSTEHVRRLLTELEARREASGPDGGVVAPTHP